ncbi:MAG: glycosyltransferase family 2 protein [Armatimonadota bacterium]|nr:glycosyltransferase family 2 protein [Armatimonadota bacterium]
MQIDLSVVIVNWNTCSYLRKCLASVELDRISAMEVIVVDNASVDGSQEMVEREFPQVKLIKNTSNLGFSRAANIGIKASKGRYILLLNPDSEVQPGALSVLVKFADSNPRAGLFGPKILNADGSLQSSARRFPTPLAALFRNTFLGRLFPNNQYVKQYLMADWDHSSPREVDWLSGAALMLRREMLDEIGLLDERFFMYCEDVDIAYRAKQKGWKAIYFPEAKIVHFLAKSSDQAPNKMILTFHQSMYAFYKKHYADRWSLPIRVIIPVGIFARAALFIANNYIQTFLRLLTLRGRREATKKEQSSEPKANAKE